MENKIYKVEYKKTEKIMLYIMLALFIVTSFLNIFRLLNLFSLVSFDLFIDISGLIISILLAFFIITTLFSSKYTIKNDVLIEQISIFKKSIKIDKICKIVVHDSQKNLFIFFTNEKDKPTFMKINIIESSFDDFATTIKSVNSSILYETISGEQK